MTRVAWRAILSVGALLLLLTYFWLQSRTPDLERRTQWLETLRTLELRDAELMRDVLLARAGLLPNYDTLTRTGQELIRLSGELRASLPPGAPDTPATLVAPADAMATAVQERLARVENFKSDNALLRNSLMYFDRAGRKLKAPANARVAAKVAPLWQAMLSFVETVDADLGREIQSELDRIAKLPSLPDDAQALVAHGRLIVEVLPQLDELMREIIGTPTAAHVGVLQDALRDYGRQVEWRAQQYRLLLYLL
ncbi:MAG: hypothetical protein FJ189_13570, partial [Gammaproteobacteria bacterium]|nr:hypothetical protein [Gammaproteobacteria bacterium]